MIAKRWTIAEPMPPALLREYRGISQTVAQLLYNRGLRTAEEAQHFLYDRDLSKIAGDPRTMKDMRKAVQRITRAIKSHEKIFIYGDFDADGVTSTTLLMEVLTRLKANVEAYIPHRVDEGYGLNSGALRDIARRGAKLVVTVDCGIRAIQEVEDGKAAGLDIIITDHHSIGPEIPRAYAVVNPQQADCPGDTNIAGVGVAYMVARSLLLEAYERNGRNQAHLDLYKKILDDLLDLVAIGTVADIMPLNTSLNRAIVRKGLQVINSGQRPGVRALLDVAGVKVGQATAMSIGFGLGPRINAAGRLDSAMVAYRLLSVRSQQQAQQLAEELNQLNSTRQQLTAEAQERITTSIQSNGLDSEQLIFAVDKQVVPGIVGLVAGRLTEAYYRPTVVVEHGEEECHASCRSIPQFHITQALDECADLLVRHGGHAMAAGLTVLPENLAALQDRLLEKARAVLDGQQLLPSIAIDMVLQPRHMSMNLAEDLAILEPTGHENPAPVFVTYGMNVRETRTVGKDDAHLKLKLQGEGEPPIDAIGFRLGHWALEMPPCVDIVYSLEINEWQGRRNIQLNLKDMRASEGA